MAKPSIQIVVHELKDDTRTKPGRRIYSRAVTFKLNLTRNGIEVSDAKSKFLLVLTVYDGEITLLGWDQSAKPEEPNFVRKLADL